MCRIAEVLFCCKSVEVRTIQDCRLVDFMHERKVNEERSINEEDVWQEHGIIRFVRMQKCCHRPS